MIWSCVELAPAGLGVGLVPWCGDPGARGDDGFGVGPEFVCGFCSVLACHGLFLGVSLGVGLWCVGVGGALDEPESLILAQSERWRHA